MYYKYFNSNVKVCVSMSLVYIHNSNIHVQTIFISITNLHVSLRIQRLAQPERLVSATVCAAEPGRCLPFMTLNSMLVRAETRITTKW